MHGDRGGEDERAGCCLGWGKIGEDEGTFVTGVGKEGTDLRKQEVIEASEGEDLGMAVVKHLAIAGGYLSLRQTFASGS